MTTATPRPAAPLTAGHLCTVVFSAETDAMQAFVAYERAADTWLEVGGARIVFDAGNGPAFVVFTGAGLEKQMEVFAGSDMIRSVQLGFHGPTSGDGAVVKTPASFTTSNLAMVSAFTGVQKIGWGAFSKPYMIPTGAAVSRLTFKEHFSVELFDVESKETMVESKDFQPLHTTIIHGGAAFLSGAELGGGKASASKAGFAHQAL